MKILDLFCCCGGASTGMSNLGHDITGVDINDDHDYPYDFIHSDVFALRLDFLQKFDFIWASPPCQHFCWSTSKKARNSYPDLVARTRELLRKVGKPFVIENVPTAPLRKDLMLCGTMFGLRLIRHRIFEIHGFMPSKRWHPRHRARIINKNGKSRCYYMQVAGHGSESYSFKVGDWREAMQLPHIKNREHLVEAVPPKYSQYIVRSIEGSSILSPLEVLC